MNKTAIILSFLLLLLLSVPRTFAQPAGLEEYTIQSIYYPSEEKKRQPPSYGFIFWCGADTTKPLYDRMMLFGDTLYNLGRYEEALHWYFTVLPYFRLFSRHNVPRIYVKIGNAYAGQYKDKEAIDAYMKALEIIEPVKKNEIIKATLQGNIANQYYRIGNYDKAMAYLDKALPAFRRNKDTISIARVLMVKASIIWRSKKKKRWAIENYKAAYALVSNSMTTPDIDLFHDAQKTGLIGSLITNIANFYLEQNMPDSALTYLDKLQRIIPYLPSGKQAGIYLTYGSAFVRKKEYAMAIPYLERGLDIAQKEDIKYYMMHVRKVLGLLYEGRRDYQNAWLQARDIIRMQDELFEAAKKQINHISNLESKYQLAQKDNELMQQQLLIARQQQSITQKNLLIVSISSGSLIFVLVTFALYRNYRRKQRLLLQQKEIEQLKTKIGSEEQERSRIGRQLHDDVMVEFSIARMNLVALQKQRPEMRYIEGLEEITRQFNLAGVKLRQAAHNLMPDALLEEGLLSAINYFCTGVRKTSGIDINFQHYGDLPRLEEDVEINLYRIVQELVQNVIKHASATKIMVQLFYRPGSLSITVEDNGIGIRNKQKATGGMGLKSIRTRLRTIDGTIDIHDVEPHGTSVHIEVNV